MADVKQPKLPEDVAASFKYVGNGAAKYGVGNTTINIETITLAQAEALVAAGAHFLKRKPKRKPKQSETDPT